MKVASDKKRIEDIFNRGVIVEVFPSREELIKIMESGKRLKIYIGADPTSDALHLSHAKNYMLLEELRQLGHEVIILFGDFTARIGDPSDRADTRPQLSEAQIKQNVDGWLAQIKPLMDFDDKDNPPRILFNSQWLAKLSFGDVLSLAGQFTVQQMIERDMFQKRLKNQQPIHLHEFFYPLMQGYDSVAMDVDVELCGTDQTFNALAGRTLMKRLKNKDKFVLVVNLMENPRTKELMSKSRGVGVFLSSQPNEMYGAVMSQPDEMIEVLLVNNTRIPLSEIKNILGEGPRQAKGRAAFEIVRIFYGKEKALAAEEEFNRTFSQKGLPEDILEIDFTSDKELSEQLIDIDLISSKSEWRRLIEEGAIKDENGAKITEIDFTPDKTTILKVGKRRFVKLNLK